ncbi:hypothetical protein CDD80_5998 [Ophiocordyceps camponoti-rufipedis]|uniref:Uncharacterized protein n=1 Tax=Ophiocordyceps camponoti-rufipedis TaxID=2004952 RepID=A0A2C5YU73_9HYPO|nr:hypothetical protein CDD80_5998 [Ophiocordyceps camponoti-rufipedis]
MQKKLLILTLYGATATAQSNQLRPWIFTPEQPRCKTFLENCIGTVKYCNSFVNRKSPYSSPEDCFQQREDKRWKLPDAPCHEWTERCVGTQRWCESMGRAPYKSHEACFLEREDKLWLFPREDCFEKTEECVGTQEWCLSMDRWDAAYESPEACFEDRERSSSQPPRIDCQEFTESCIGTEVWCRSMGRWDSPYTSPGACFRDRARKPKSTSCQDSDNCDQRVSTPEPEKKLKPWIAPGIECQDVEESCVGTEVWCSRTQYMAIRQLCFTAREEAPWLPADTQDCRDVNEACVGTDKWCETDRARFIYGSAKSCLSVRQPPPPSWQHPQLEECKDNGQKDCEGTELYCGRFSRLEDRLRCFAAHQKAPFSIVHSSACEQNPTDELCNGTANWCRQKPALQLYGSEENCRKFRGKKPDEQKWQPKANNCTEPNESCLGTEHICNSFSQDDLRTDCFSARETPPILPPDRASCLGNRRADESCLGTYVWCADRFRQAGYLSARECFEIRQWSFGDFETQLRDGLLASLDGLFTKVLVNMTAETSPKTAKVQFGKVLRVVRENGNASTALAAGRALSRYQAFEVR